MRSADIREAFAAYFASHGHERVPSGPLVPEHDPTLMFANAGMVPFKDVFVGQSARPYRRATTAQKCIRISGKHNDLENVGVTARHHTFFEMLGNFSFGDYFKREAIAWAWRFVIDVLQLPEERLVVTVFGGEDGVEADEEAARLWREIAGVPEERIFRLGKADNFWQMGDTGPCGPCSEIHFFLGEGKVDPRTFGQEPAASGAGWFELWNLVFMQFDRQADGRLKDLPAPSIDTGAGLERLAVVKQGVLSNYDTDLLRPVVNFAAERSGKRYGASQAPDDVSMRVIADHARTTAFLLAEGVFPDRDGRSYVLRRVMRRAIRHGHRLGIEQPFLHDAALCVVEEMSGAYPELLECKALIADVTRQEEERFRSTLRRGLDLIDAWVLEGGPHDGQATDDARGVATGTATGAVMRARATPERVDAATIGPAHSERESLAGEVQRVSAARTLPGEIAFRLYDTFGFPLDLQEVIARERGFEVDATGFEQAMSAARQRSAGSKVGSAGIDAWLRHLADELGETTFVGYDSLQTEAEVRAIVVDGASVAELVRGEGKRDGLRAQIMLTRTSMYAESGGQVSDRGRIVRHTVPEQNADHLPDAALQEEAVFLVRDVQKPVGALFVHEGVLESGRLRVGDKVRVEVDVLRRARIRANHSATHLLHHALREVLGPQAMQRGSRVGPEGLRFDYASSRALTVAEMRRLEDAVLEAVLCNEPVVTEVLSMHDAKAKGAVGIFEEKYGDVVRMLRIGPSLELCGGTHVARTGDIGAFKIVQDGGLAAGVRRLEAVTGASVMQHLRGLEDQVQACAALLKTQPNGVVDKTRQQVERTASLTREVEQLQAKLLRGSGSDHAAEARERDGIQWLGHVVEVADPKAIRALADQLRDRLMPAVVLLGAVAGPDKVILVCSVSKEITSRVKAGDVVKRAAAVVGGSGGGRPDFAQAGGSDTSKLSEAVATVYTATP